MLGVDPTTTTDEQITQACRDAEIHDFITSLPEGTLPTLIPPRLTTPTLT